MQYKIITKNNVKYIEFPHIREVGIFTHGFSTRVGGISPPPFDGLNLGFTTSDAEENLSVNRRLFLDALGISGKQMHQLVELVHGYAVLNANQLKNNEIPEADGIVTNQKNILLVATFADCIPIFLADPVKKVCAVIHAGWRGTFQDIAAQGVKKMTADFGSNPRDILAGIGPGIGRCCFETGSGVANSFFYKYPQWKDLIKEIFNNNQDKKWKIDLPGLNLRILLKAGLSEGNVCIADLCTFCRKDLFFSYRRDGAVSGRMAAVIMKTA